MDNSIWMIVCAAMIFFMQAGFTCYEAGLVQSKNVISVAVENIFSLSAGVLSFGIVGFVMMFGTYPHGPDGTAFFMVHLMYAMICATLFAGAMSERTRITPLIVASAVVAGIIYPVFGRWTWHSHYGTGSGWLEQLGFVDYSGACVVSMTAGFVALAGITIVGPRNDFNNNSTNLPLAVLGVFIIWFGWFFYNGAATEMDSGKLPLIFTNVVFAAAAGTLGALEANFMRKQRGEYLLSCFNGCLSGLVSITALSAYCTPLEAGVVGIMAGILADFTDAAMKYKGLDDVVHVVPIHLVGGLVGTLSVAGFAQIEYLNGHDRVGQLGIQIITIIFCALWSYGTAYFLFKIMNRYQPIRITKDQEDKGLNIVEFNDLFSWNNYLETSNYQREILEKNKVLAKQTELLTKTEEQEKIKLARDLHDGLGQSLAAMKVMIAVGEKQLRDGKPLSLAKTADKISDLADESISEMRVLINNLKPAILEEEGLAAGIGNLVDNIASVGGLQCEFKVFNPIPDFDETTMLNIYRLIQESLTNVVKHSYATHVEVSCRDSLNEDYYIFSVNDNGIGFEIEPNNPGIGISSMNNRVTMIGGRLNIFSHPGEGTHVIMEVPK